MKKFLVLLIALVTLLTMAPMAFAAEGTLVDGDNEIELAWDAEDAAVYTYTATETGTLYIMVTEFYYSYKDGEYNDNNENMYEFNWNTELIVDGNPMIGGYYGYIDVEKGETYTFSWAHTYRGGFGWMAVMNLSYNDDLLPEFGTEDYPIEIYPSDCPVKTITVPAGEEVYYTLCDFDGAMLQLTGKGAYVAFTAIDLETAQMEEYLYEADGGEVLAFINTSYLTIRIGNDSSTNRSYTLDYYYPEGTEKNPVPLEMGENVAYTEAESYDGYYFSWTVEEEGILYLEFNEDDGWRYRVYNVTTRTWGDEVIYGLDGAENPSQIYVYEDDELLIIVNSFDTDTLTIPGGEVTFIAYLGHEHIYGEGELTTSAENCQEVGEITYTCEICGDTKVETFQGEHVLDHQEEGYEPTCAEDGCQPYWYCAYCQTYYRDEEMTDSADREDLAIPATGDHRDADGMWDVDDERHYHVCQCGQILDEETHAGTEATCASKAVCDVCDAEFGEFDADNHLDTEIRDQEEATCTVDGYTGDTYCNDCQQVIEDGATIPATGDHRDADDEWDVDENRHYHVCQCGEVFDEDAHFGGEATCSELAICEICDTPYGDYDTENHWNTELYDQVDATCAEDGYTGDLICVDCGECVEEGTVIPATGEHVDADGLWDVDEDIHYYVCACGALLDEEAHTGGEANCVDQAICQICNAPYGELDPEKHSETQIQNQVAETCAQDGYTGDAYCTACGALAEEGTAIPATGNHVDADGKWESDGDKHYHVCQCGQIIDEQAHSGGTATCVAKASCAICGTEYGVYDSASHGNTEIRDAVEETCASEGYTGDTYCADCGSKVSDGSVIPANGKHVDEDGEWEHDADGHWHTCACMVIFEKYPHAYGPWQVVKEAGEEDGLMRHSCDCGYTEEIVIPAQHTHSYETVVTAPTCYENGYTTYTCSCGYYYTGDEVPGGHVLAESGTAKEATCAENGALAYWYCGVCQTYFADAAMTEATTQEALVIPALSHTYETVFTAPTCTESGYTTYTCTCCGATYTDDMVEPAHQLDQQAETVEATCTEPGRKAYWHCRVCDGYFTDEAMTAATSWEELTIPAKEHSAGVWTVVKEAAIGDPGLRQQNCTVCGQMLEEEQIPALETAPAQTTMPGGTQEPQGGGTVLVIVVVIVVAAAATAAVVIFKKKRA